MDLTCVRASRSGATVNIEHPVGVRPRQNSPLFSLRFEGRISIPMSGRESEKRRRRKGEGGGGRWGGRRERGGRKVGYKEREPCVRGLQVPETVNGFVAFKTGE